MKINLLKKVRRRYKVIYDVDNLMVIDNKKLKTLFFSNVRMFILYLKNKMLK
jgi:hypothetical protein